MTHITPEQWAEADRIAAEMRKLPPERQLSALAHIDGESEYEEVSDTATHAPAAPAPTSSSSALDVLRDDPELRTVTLSEMADHFGLSTKTLHRDIAAGRLNAVKLGPGYAVTVAEVREWLRRRAVRKPRS